MESSVNSLMPSIGSTVPRWPTPARSRSRRPVVRWPIALLSMVCLTGCSPPKILYGNKGYDSDAVRRTIESRGAEPNIPPKPSTG
jgi:hypothetical protein